MFKNFSIASKIFFKRIVGLKTLKLLRRLKFLKELKIAENSFATFQVFERIVQEKSKSLKSLCLAFKIAN